MPDLITQKDQLIASAIDGHISVAILQRSLYDIGFRLRLTAEPMATCEYCGRFFDRTRSDRRFCTATCKANAHIKRKAATEAGTKTENSDA